MNNTSLTHFIRSKKVSFHPSTDDIQFQIIDCYGEDIEEQFNDRFQMKKYRINLFGITKEGYSVYCEVNDFHPYFFIQCPWDWSKYDTERLKEYLRKGMGMDEEWRYNLKDIKLVKGKIFRGFTGNKKYNFLKLIFKSHSCMKECKKYLYRRYEHNGKYIKFKQFESNLDPLLRFFHRKQIKPCGWVKIEKNAWKKSKKNKSRCQFELKTKWTNCELLDIEQIAPIVIASFDIECTSEDGSFPQFSRKNDNIIQIGTSIEVLGKPELSINHIVTLKSCDEIENAIVEYYETEKEVLLAWTRFIQNIDPDIITGYNIDGFDYQYLYERSKLLNCNYQFGLLGRLRETSSKIKLKELSSSALGKNYLKLMPMLGRVSIDLMRYTMGNFKLTSYKLDNVAQHFLGKEYKKNPVTPKMIFDYQKIDSKHRKIVAEYCIQDCKLVNYLMNKLCVIVNNVGMANVCYVPFSYLFTRGQQIKIFSLISKECRENGFLIPILNKNNFTNDGYQGATVLNAQTGFYKEPVVCLDYASLYPSTMISENLSVDTLVMSNQYRNLPGYKYKYVKINDERTHTFVQAKKNKDGTYERGLIPNILIRLLQARKDTKKRMKDEKDDFMKSILDGLQLSYKVVCNSVYGSMGASISPVYCQPVAESTTAMGRWYLELGRDKVLERFPGTGAVYGDSVTGRTPILLKNKKTNKIEIHQIEDLNNQWKEYKNFKIYDDDLYCKQYNELNDYMVWTDKGWSNIKKIIRHKTNKKIYQVCTKSGYVEVTEDHSLLDKNRKILKPLDCKDDTRLLHSYPKYNFYDIDINVLENYKKSNYKRSNTLFNAYKYLILKLSFKKDDLSAMYSDEPFHILNKNEICNIKTKDENRKYNIDINQISYKNDYYLNIYYMRKSNYNEFVYDLETEEGVFQAGVGDIIVKNTDSCFYKFDTGYDLTSETFLKKSKEEKNKIRKKALKKAIDIGFEAEKYMQTLLPYPHKFEYEKTYLPFILFSKKRYTGKLYETDIEKAKYIDAKGIVLKRRDNAKIVKTIYGGANQIIMDEIDIEKAKNYVINSLDKLVKGKLPEEEFIVTKTYKPPPAYKAYKIYIETGDEKYLSRLPAQVTLGTRIAKRDPGNAPQSNERLKYIYIEKKAKKGEKILQGDKIETPEYIKENKLKIDYLHYITNQLQNPLTQLFIPLLLPQSKLSEKEQFKQIEKVMFSKSLRYAKNKKNNQKSLESWFIKK